MWWSRALPLLLLLLLPGLAGCGFRPLYAEDSSGTSVTQSLAQVRVVPIADRPGQVLHNELRDLLNPKGQPVSPTHDLVVRLTEVRQELGVRKDETATRANLLLTADFDLRPAGSRASGFTGRSRAIVSFNIVTSPYATQVAEEDARERGIQQVARDIRARLATHLASGANR